MIDNTLFSQNFIRMHYDEQLGDNVELEQTNVSKYYKHAYVLAKRTNKSIPSEFYNLSVPKDIYDTSVSNLLIHKVSIKLLKNKKHFIDFVILSNDQLNPFNIFNYELDSKNIVIPFYNIEYTNLLKYVEQYETTNTLENIYKVKVLDNYFKFTKSPNLYLQSMIGNLEESNHWTHGYNCMFNMNSRFRDRKFFYSPNRIVDKSIAEILRNKINIDIKSKKDYDFKELERDTIDMKGEFKSYIMNNNNEFTNDDIVKLFKTLDEKEKFMLFSNLLISKKYCHIVINNMEILEMMKSTIYRFALLFRYLFSYAWIRFYIEENLKGKNVKTSDQFIFDINTASELPIFPFNYTCPKENPYMPLLVADKELKGDNFIGIDISDTVHHGLCNFDEFQTRMNIFTTRDKNKNLFQDVDFNKLNAVVTGSIMAACIHKEHPLTSRFIGPTLYDKYLHYFDEHYCKSDIDIMFMIKDDFDFYDKVTEFFNQIVVNICKFNESDVNTNAIRLECNKTIYVFVTEEFINSIKDESMTLKYIEDHIEDSVVKDMFKKYYQPLIDKHYDEFLKDFTPEEVESIKSKYSEIFSSKNEKVSIYINRKKQPNTFHKDINMETTFKYKITSPYLNHPFELFPSKFEDPFALVSNFHMPCVRAYYNGTNVFMTPSYISSHMTFMNIDYRYVTGTRDPMNILNQYRMKTGMGTFINTVEKQYMEAYCNEVEFWNKLYSNTEVVKVMGAQSITNKLFKPRLTHPSYYNDCIWIDYNNHYTNDLNITKNKKYDTTREIISRFNCIEINEINYSALRTINTDGMIVPVKKWIIGATWDIYENNYYIPTKKEQMNDTQNPKDKVLIYGNQNSLLSNAGKSIIYNNPQTYFNV